MSVCKFCGEQPVYLFILKPLAFLLLLISFRQKNFFLKWTRQYSSSDVKNNHKYSSDRKIFFARLLNAAKQGIALKLVYELCFSKVFKNLQHKSLSMLTQSNNYSQQTTETIITVMVIYCYGHFHYGYHA